MDERQISKLFWGVKAALIGLLLYVAVKAVMGPLQLDTAFTPKAVSGTESASGLLTTPSESPGQTDYQAIIENDVFGGSDRGALSLGGTDPAISAEDLGLTLVGAIAGGPASSRAIIHDDKTGTTRPYRIGDIITSATIESIESDRVVLRHEGRRKMLQLHAGKPATEKNRPADGDGPSAGSTQQIQSAATTPVKSSTKLGYVQEVFRKATIEPYVESGRTTGLKISGLENTPLAGFFGLKNGDVVQTVNGQQLTSKQKAFQVLQKARTQPNVSMQLLRDGKARDLSFDL